MDTFFVRRYKWYFFIYTKVLHLTIFIFFFRKRWYHCYSSASQRRTAMDLTCKIQARIGTRRADGSCFNSKKPYLPFRSLIIYNNYLPKCWVDLSSNLRGIIDFFCLGQSQDQYNSMYGSGNKYLGVSNLHARTPALRKASSVFQIRCGNFQNGLFRP